MSVNQETEMTRNGHATDVCTNSMKHISLEQMEPEPSKLPIFPNFLSFNVIIPETQIKHIDPNYR